MGLIPFLGILLAAMQALSCIAREIDRFRRLGGFGRKPVRKPDDPPKEGREGCPTCGEILRPNATTCPVCILKYT